MSQVSMVHEQPLQETDCVYSKTPTWPNNMSLAKAVPDGLKDYKCKKTALRECPPIPYVPKKDCVQEMVSSFKDNHLKTQKD